MATSRLNPDITMAGTTTTTRSNLADSQHNEYQTTVQGSHGPNYHNRATQTDALMSLIRLAPLVPVSHSLCSFHKNSHAKRLFDLCQESPTTSLHHSLYPSTSADSSFYDIPSNRAKRPACLCSICVAPYRIVLYSTV